MVSSGSSAALERDARWRITREQAKPGRAADEARTPMVSGGARDADPIARFTPCESRAHRLLRFAIVALGAALMIASSAAAASASPASTPEAAAPDFSAQIAAALQPLLEPGTRLGAVVLQCHPPANAVIQTVAPGVSRLQSRGIVVEFLAGDRQQVCGATVSAERQVLVAAHDIAPRQPVAGGDFSRQWLDAFTAAPGAAGEFPSSGPYVSATLIRAGQPLYPNQIARPVAVHPGDLVTVIVKNGGVTVRTQLEARSEATVGDTATMINPASGNPVAVTVTGERTAELVMR
jgi:flagella basal body P-ring formation protein FlgA